MTLLKIHTRIFLHYLPCLNIEQVLATFSPPVGRFSNEKEVIQVKMFREILAIIADIATIASLVISIYMLLSA